MATNAEYFEQINAPHMLVSDIEFLIKKYGATMVWAVVFRLLEPNINKLGFKVSTENEGN